jgi:glycosyltransferase involved in cell wall biosynthesis
MMQDRKQKALVFLDINETGGTGAYAKRLARFLSGRYSLHIVLRDKKRGASIPDYFLSLGCSLSYDYILHRSVDRFMLKVASRFGVSLFYELIRDLLAVQRLIRRYRPDLIAISQGGGCGFFPFLFSRLPTILVMHTMLNDSIYKNRFGRFYISLYGRIDQGNKRLINVSDCANLHFCRNIHSPRLSAISCTIYNYGEEMTRQRGYRNRLNVLTLGHLEQYKNPEAWIQTAQRLALEHPGCFNFIWAGDGGMLDEVRRLTSEDRDISFIGYRSEVKALYASTDIYFQPSLAESHGISVVEALGAGIPCIVSSAGGLPESVTDGMEGFICAPESVEDYVNAFERFVDNRPLLEILGRNARSKYLRLFTMRAWETKMISMLDEVTSITGRFN